MTRFQYWRAWRRIYKRDKQRARQARREMRELVAVAAPVAAEMWNAALAKRLPLVTIDDPASIDIGSVGVCGWEGSAADGARTCLQATSFAELELLRARFYDQHGWPAHVNDFAMFRESFDGLAMTRDYRRDPIISMAVRATEGDV